MTTAQILILLGIAISIIANGAYILDTIRGKTKPNRVTWFMWALAPLVGGSISLFSGADPWVTSRVILAGVLPGIVFLSSFVDRQAYWKLTAFDVACGILSLLAFALWFQTRQSAFAILLAILADLLASVPTFRKIWKFPETETVFTYVLYAASFIVVLPAITVWDVENAAFPVYLIGLNLSLVFLAYRGRSLRG